MKSIFRKTTLLAAAFFAVALSSTAAFAQYNYPNDDQDRGGWNGGNRDRDRDHDRDGWNRGSFGYDRGNYGERVEVARRFGFGDGTEVAAEDIRYHKRFNSDPRGRFHGCDRGYHREFGDKGWYKEAYARAYRNGYDQEYRRAERDYGWRR